MKILLPPFFRIILIERLPLSSIGGRRFACPVFEETVEMTYIINSHCPGDLTNRKARTFQQIFRQIHSKLDVVFMN